MATTKSTTKVKKPATVKKTSTGLVAPLYNLKAEKVGEIGLSKSIFGAKINQKLISEVVRSYLSARRSSHAKVKDRGEVAGTTKKMWSQKGTGRARHGSAKAGIFVGGGSAHGPQGNQSFELAVNKKVRKAALNSLLSAFAKNSSIVAVADLASISGKTRDASNFMEKLESAVPSLAGSAKIAIISGSANDKVIRSFRNIPGFTLMSRNSLNVLDLASQNVLLFEQSVLESLK